MLTNTVVHNPIDQLSSHLSHAGETLAELAQSLDAHASQTDASYGNTIDPTGLIEQLQALLSDNNMQAMPLYTQLRPQLTNISTENLARLDAAMDNLDFISARQLLELLRPEQANHD